MNNYKFSGIKYITSGINNTIPNEIQFLLFSSIKRMSEKTNGELDYLQIFRLTTSEINGKLLL